MAPIRLPLPTRRPDDTAPALNDSPLDRAVARIERECGSGVVVTGELERRAVAHDASHYLMQPRAVLRPRDTHEVGRIFAAAADIAAFSILRAVR